MFFYGGKLLNIINYPEDTPQRQRPHKFYVSIYVSVWVIKKNNTLVAVWNRQLWTNTKLSVWFIGGEIY